jgi:hypothetical protein
MTGHAVLTRTCSSVTAHGGSDPVTASTFPHVNSSRTAHDRSRTVPLTVLPPL